MSDPEQYAKQPRDPHAPFYLNDLKTDREMLEFVTKIGDIVAERTVVEIEITDAGMHPKTREHLTQVSLKLV